MPPLPPPAALDVPPVSPAMPSLELFCTHIRSNRQLHDRHELAFRLLAPVKQHLLVKDVASDDDARRRWKLKNAGNTELPCLLVNGVRIGDIEDLQMAVEDGKLRQFLRLENPPSRPSFDDDLESISSDQVDELLAAYGEEYERSPRVQAIVPLDTPPATPKTVYEAATPVAKSKPFLPGPIPPLTPPDTPQFSPDVPTSPPPPVVPSTVPSRAGLNLHRATEAAHVRSVSTASVALPPVPEKGALGSPLMRPQASREAITVARQRSQSSLRSLSQLPPLPPSASSTATFGSLNGRGQPHQRSISSLRQTSGPPVVVVAAAAPSPSAVIATQQAMHRKQQSSLGDLVAEIDAFLTPQASPAVSLSSRPTFHQQQQQQQQNHPAVRQASSVLDSATNPGDVPLKDFLPASPNLGGPVAKQRPRTPELNDPSGYAGGMGMRQSQRDGSRTPPSPEVARGPQSFEGSSKSPATAPVPPKKGGLFSCCGSGAAAHMED